MAEAKRDGNHVPTLIGVSSADGTTPTTVYVDPITHRLYVDLSGGGSGDVVGPASSTDNAVARWDSTTGQLLQDSTVIIGDTGNVTGLGTLNALTIPASNFVGLTDSQTLTNKTLTTPVINVGSDATGDMYYRSAGGVFTRIAAGAENTVLTMGASSVPAWAAASGGGNVSNTGTPLNNQIAVWTDATTIEGDADLTFDTATNTLTTGTLNASTLTASEIVLTDASKNLVSAAVATYPSLTELTYLKGVTSAIQTQLGTKQATITFGTGVQTALGVNIGSAGAPVLFNGALGTPSSGTVTNLTGTASININGTVGATTPSTGVFTTLVAGSTTSLLLGTAGSAVGNIGFRNATSGTITLAPVTGALGTVTLSLPAITDTLVTLTASQTLTNKTLTSPAIGGTALLAEGGSIGLDPAGSADGKYTGITVTATAGYTQAFGDLVYLAVADSRWELADADAAATAGPVALAMVVVAGTDGNACTLLLQGIIRADAKFPAMTVGATQYVGETAGAIQGTIPTGADNIIRTVGYALTADELYFNPSTDWQVTVA